MTVSLRVMSAGGGYQYLLRSVASGRGDPSLSTPMTRYYSEEGTPPGRWLGSGLPGLGGGRLVAGKPVTEPQLALLLGMGRDPVTGEPLGRAYPEFRSVSERAAERRAQIPQGLSDQERDARVAQIEAEEALVGARRAVAGYDMTFSVPKSVSVLWGLADPETQVRILEAHHAAVADVLRYVEREVAATRTGVASGDGAVAQVAVSGVCAAAYDHWDSRSGDPQLHTHVVLSNKVQARLDGRWRSLDGRPVHAAMTAISAHYNAVLADRLTQDLSVEWEERSRGQDRNPQWEIGGVEDRLMAEFSSRSRSIEQEKDRLIAEYVAQHGRRPRPATVIRLRAQATLSSRPEKRIRSLADLTAEWRERALGFVGPDPSRWAWALVSRAAPGGVSASDIPLEEIDRLAAGVVTAVSEKRSTWRRWNLWAEASRRTMHLRFGSSQHRETLVCQVVHAAERLSVALTPPELASSPPEFRRDDGTSVFRPRHATVFSSVDVMAAEDRLIGRAEDRSAPVALGRVLHRASRRTEDGLSRTQLVAVEQVMRSGRRVDLLVGPAGAGKTTTLRALRASWLSAYGRHAVVGLAPSAAAAQVLADDLGSRCENTAKWLHDHDRGLVALGPNQLVLIDEATLASTSTLDRITELAERAGAKVVLVGDSAQLQSVDAGGAFSLLVSQRSDVAELADVHRFENVWEGPATLRLRSGDVGVLSTYALHGRICDGVSDEMLNAAYQAWRADMQAGKRSLLITDNAASMHALNVRARADRILADETKAGREVALADDSRASVGDLVITRRNDRRLRTRRGEWVRNGDRWVVVDVRRDGSLILEGAGRRVGRVVVPPEYASEHVDLGYAVTAHRAQGMTVDCAHVLVTRSSTRENLYVAMTRGRSFNKAYVALDDVDASHAAPPEARTGSSVLAGVLRRSGAELSAHETAMVEQEAWSSVAQLAAEYETIAAVAQRPRWIAALGTTSLTREQVRAVIDSDSFGPLSAAFRCLEGSGIDVETLLPSLVASRSLFDAQDVGAVLISRVQHEIGRRAQASIDGSRLIVGLVPKAHGAPSGAMRDALLQRERLMERRVATLTDQALNSNYSWLTGIGDPPTHPGRRGSWVAQVQVVVAYRDRYGVTGSAPLGPAAQTEAQRIDRRAAIRALRRAIDLRHRDLQNLPLNLALGPPVHATGEPSV